MHDPISYYVPVKWLTHAFQISSQKRHCLLGSVCVYTVTADLLSWLGRPSSVIRPSDHPLFIVRKLRDFSAWIQAKFFVFRIFNIISFMIVFNFLIWGPMGRKNTIRYFPHCFRPICTKLYDKYVSLREI